MNSVKNYTLTPKAVSEEHAHKVDSFDPMAENRAMGATNTMALYTMALLSYISFLPSSPVITLATPSLASQENNSDLNDDDSDDSDDIIPNLVNISSASSKDTFRPSVGSFFAKGQPREPALHQLQRHDFFITYIKEFTPRCSLLCYLWQPRSQLCHHSFAYSSQQSRCQFFPQLP
ncbi:hypothetical protein D6D26_10020 [Aureobasidium pullulans]|nr:hypothetical protein D6D26_10020 [Aureobasidium pullulans]